MRGYQQVCKIHEPKDMRLSKHTSTWGYGGCRDGSKGTWTWGYEDVRMWGYKQTSHEDKDIKMWGREDIKKTNISNMYVGYF